MTESDTLTFSYFPVPEIVTRMGLYVTGVGTDVIPPHSSYPRQKHPELYDFTWRAGRVLPDYQFVFIAAGSGEFETRESGNLKVTAGTVMMLYPDVWHRYRPNPETGWTEYWISMGGELLFQWHERGLFQSDRPLAKLRSPNDTLKQYRSVVDFIVKNPERDAPQLAAHAMAIVTSAMEASQNALKNDTPTFKSSSPIDPSVIQSLRIIWNHSHQRISVETIAKEVGVSRRTLERRFREQRGCTILQELVKCRMQRAKRLLRETNVPIKYIAYAAGFSSLSNLCKVFRRELDSTPGQYRGQLSEVGKPTAAYK